MSFAPDYSFATLKKPVVALFHEHFSNASADQQPLTIKCLSEVNLDPTFVTGPHAQDRNALYWPFEANVWTKNRHGSLHGGIGFLLMDSLVCVHLAAVLGSYHHMTTSMQATYVRAIQLGKPMILKTLVVRTGAVACFLECEIVAADAPNVSLLKANITKATLPQDQAPAKSKL